MRHWLMKSEPDVFGIDNLREKKTNSWDGVRGYQARNFMMEMEVGDQVLFYHSSATPSGVAGLATVVKQAYPDHTAWDPASEYFDPKSTPEKPLWKMVDVGYVRTLPRFLSLDELKAIPELRGMMLFSHGRLSVQPVSKEHFDYIVALAERPAPSAAGKPRAKPADMKAKPKAAKPSAAKQAAKPAIRGSTAAKPRPAKSAKSAASTASTASTVKRGKPRK